MSTLTKASIYELQGHKAEALEIYKNIDSDLYEGRYHLDEYFIEAVRDNNKAYYEKMLTKKKITIDAINLLSYKMKNFNDFLDIITNLKDIDIIHISKEKIFSRFSQ